ncbi:uncharacterized protein CLAFUR5_05683 [Fulvia fulva]|uniref:MYND-type domain-containing protein n=1 Tax=Passalora fulva TaxID=5499 RepID=A0A9Q8LIZ9_PASFU|nr:uncharacterized protein CLAFUR5_05683 [Fulvia fulva]KAK4624909.1 hypothetical protein CLAFUR0_05544 [Fulvia fulva]UJO18382.1 hypothetical protein CLAFUR5_05683 [Fulvia fulva]
MASAPGDSTNVTPMATTSVLRLHVPPDDESGDPTEMHISADPFNDDTHWVISPISKQLGLPVKVAIYSSEDAQQENETARLLFLDAEIGSPSFALSTCDPCMGPVIVLRCDGQDIDATTRLTLTGKTQEYIHDVRDRFDDLKSGEQTIEEFYAHARARFTRESAAKLYRDLMDGIAGYLNPFKAITAGGIRFCAGCGAIKATSGRALLVCGRCGVGRYCSRECQKQEWQVHKSGCKKPI